MTANSTAQDRDRHDEHGHGESGGHAHGVNPDADRRWLTIALMLILGFMVAEVTVGVIGRSLALISDAAHMLTDAASIILALVAIRLAARPARGTYTYGLKRAEILSAQANGLSLLLLGAWLAYEATRRLLAPPDVAGGLVLLTALAGIVVNIAAAWAMSRANRSSLNVQGAFQHILNDLYAFIATAIAGAIMLWTGFARADAIASLIVVALMVKAGIGLLRESGRILLEAAPAGLDPDTVADRLLAQPHVVEVHDLHVWTITSNQPALSAHVLVEPAADCHAVRVQMQTLLSGEYALTHATLQVDHVGEHLLRIATGTPGEEHCADPHGPVHRGDTHNH
jgi:cobalt-zinc-cadmium efflux system protein